MHTLQERHSFVRRKVVRGRWGLEAKKKNILRFHWGYNKKELQKWELGSDIRKIISKLRRVIPQNRLP